MLCCYFDFMDPSTSALAPVDQPATAPPSIINAPGEQVASTRTMPAPHIDAPAEGSIVVDDDSPLTTASDDVFRQLPWDDLGRSDACQGPELQLQRICHQVPIVLMPSAGDDTAPVEYRAPRRVVPAGSSPSHPGGSVRLRGSQSSNIMKALFVESFDHWASTLSRRCAEQSGGWGKLSRLQTSVPHPCRSCTWPTRVCYLPFGTSWTNLSRRPCTC